MTEPGAALERPEPPARHARMGRAEARAGRSPPAARRAAGRPAAPLAAGLADALRAGVPARWPPRSSWAGGVVIGDLTGVGRAFAALAAPR